MYLVLEGDVIGFNVFFQIVIVDVKWKFCCYVEQLFKGLWFYFDIFKLVLGYCIVVVWVVLVVKIYLFVMCFVGDILVRDFVQGVGKKFVCKYDMVIGCFIVSWKVDWFIVVFNQVGIKFFGKVVVEKVYQLLIMVLLLY